MIVVAGRLDVRRVRLELVEGLGGAVVADEFLRHANLLDLARMSAARVAAVAESVFHLRGLSL
jgi:hypothetical protein